MVIYRKSFTTSIVASLLATSAMSAVAAGFGESVQQLLEAQAVKYFGVIKPLTTSATGSVPRAPVQTAFDLVLVAAGLQATILTRAAGVIMRICLPFGRMTRPRHTWYSA